MGSEPGSETLPVMDPVMVCPGRLKPSSRPKAARRTIIMKDLPRCGTAIRLRHHPHELYSLSRTMSNRYENLISLPLPDGRGSVPGVSEPRASGSVKISGRVGRRTERLANVPHPRTGGSACPTLPCKHFHSVVAIQVWWGRRFRLPKERDCFTDPPASDCPPPIHG